ncbi:hypothetical protein [Sphingobium herbicidovorans]
MSFTMPTMSATHRREMRVDTTAPAGLPIHKSVHNIIPYVEDVLRYIVDSKKVNPTSYFIHEKTLQPKGPEGQ